MMKEDKTQFGCAITLRNWGCGLMMKEDKTQSRDAGVRGGAVVV